MEAPDTILQKLKAFRDQEDAVGTAAYLQKMETKEVVDSSFHKDMAKVCEDLGLIPRAILEYNLSLRDGPKQVPVLKKLAVIYQDQGDVERAIRLWQQVITLAPDDEEPIYELGER